MLKIISFTKNGILLSEKIKQFFEADNSEVAGTAHNPFCTEIELASRYRSEDGSDNPYFTELSIEDWAGEGFASHAALLFIGATGIAIRAIAPFVRDKLSDSPVLVMDEQGQFVISLLSGHVGGANALALEIAAAVSAVPVVTTATDQNDAFSVDLFAKENHLAIKNRDGIKVVSTRAIEGKPVRLSIKDYPPRCSVDAVITEGEIELCPKAYAVGLGCKKDKTFEEIEALFLGVLQQEAISIEDVGAIASISIKEEEPGLLALSKKYKLPFLTFDAEVLLKLEGDFTRSEFVSSQVGVDNVCERAALAALGGSERGELLVKKTAQNGVTVAVAKRIY